MSGNFDRRTRNFSKYDSMSTERLQEILRLDAHRTDGVEMDTDELFYIMEVLADRRRNDSSYTGKTIQQAFEDFQKYYMPEETDNDAADAAPAKQNKLSVLWIRRIASIAAALAIVFLTTITANAFGFDLFGKVAKWSEEFFHFEESPMDTINPVTTPNLKYNSLQHALEDYDITKNLVPTWLPNGYVFYELSIAETPREKTFYSRYTNNDNGDELSITIRQLLSGPPLNIEKNDNLVEIHPNDGIAYYIFSNQSVIHVGWVVDNFECLIVCSLPIDVVREIIDSIYLGV